MNVMQSAVYEVIRRSTENSARTCKRVQQPKHHSVGGREIMPAVLFYRKPPEAVYDIIVEVTRDDSVNHAQTRSTSAIEGFVEQATLRSLQRRKPGSEISSWMKLGLFRLRFALKVIQDRSFDWTAIE